MNVNFDGNIKPEILEELRKYQSHSSTTCLECGYTGLMGIKGATCPWFVSWWTLAVIIIVASYCIPGTFSPIILGLALAVFKFVYTRKIVVCPSCKKELHTR
ncbi:hypothetical protein NLN82_22715 [Citrobacter portucalensis]|uniref:hypothetical protein n=1 Tax=Citrobacter portucalensis TaxID=1639133 RepID=UPI00226BBB20|nr:hypothetical protein [Citrobacter portucalensis]MCX9038840.1 hypothetical protein [Citrobacter portucalensis]